VFYFFYSGICRLVFFENNNFALKLARGCVQRVLNPSTKPSPGQTAGDGFKWRLAPLRLLQ
jgi:hypothetical protein